MTYRARCLGRRVRREAREHRRGHYANGYTFVWQEPDVEKVQVSTGFPSGYSVGGHSAPVPVAGPSVDMPPAMVEYLADATINAERYLLDSLIVGIPCHVCGAPRPTTPTAEGVDRVEPCPKHPEG